MLYTLGFMILILLVTLGNLLLGFGAALYFGQGPKWVIEYLTADRLKMGLGLLKRSQKSPQPPQ